MVELGRRSALALGVAIGAGPGLLASRLRDGIPTLARQRTDQQAVKVGDVTSTSAVLWSRAAAEGRMMVRLTSNGRRLRSIRGPWADLRGDYTAKLPLDGLAPGREYAATMWFEQPGGIRGRELNATFRTAPIHPSPTSFAWFGDSCGQGWGINDDLGGLVGYAAVRDLHPDFFIHCGDHIYTDDPLSETKLDVHSGLWRNRLTPAVTQVAETLDGFRGYHRYLLEDGNFRELHAAVPIVPMWDDHETHNNWYPGLVLDDDRYTERRCDVLAARGRRAWQEYLPIRPDDVTGRGRDGFAKARIYRKISRGAHLDVFCLDMRSYRGPNDDGLDDPGQGILGTAQTDWLIRAVTASRATWKVVAADMPLCVAKASQGVMDSVGNGDGGRPLGREQEIARLLTAFKRGGVRNVIWVTGDVHYTAAHHYSPERASYTDFEPFWEFIAGPIAASTAEVLTPDPTFGPRIVFAKGNDTPVPMSPAAGNQFFGQVEIDRDGRLTVTLHSQGEGPLWSRTLEPSV